MNRLTQADLNAVAKLVDFVRGPGYVLDFTDRTFRQFFGAMKIDIDDNKYAVAGTSKGKRLRTLLESEDDATCARVLKALWDHRVSHLALSGQVDTVANAEKLYRSMLGKLTGGRQCCSEGHRGEAAGASIHRAAHEADGTD